MGLIESVFGGGDTQKQLPALDFPESKEARKRLLEITKKPLPGIPLRGIADLPAQTAERKLARETATGLAAPTEQQDIFSLPEVQGIIFEATQRGDLLANRLGRGLQKTGGASSTAGRDVLGRVSTDVSKSIAASLAPFAEAQRGRAFADVQRRQNLIPILESLGLVEEERGRATTQARLDAKFAQELGISEQELNQLIPQLQFLASLQQGSTPFVKAGRPGILEQVGAVSGALSGVGSLGGLAGQNTLPAGQAGPTQPGVLTGLFGRR